MWLIGKESHGVMLRQISTTLNKSRKVIATFSKEDKNGDHNKDFEKALF
jgi:hypothetical protein